MTYKSHLVTNGREGGVFDPVSEHSQKDVESIECKWREYPWYGKDGMVTYCNEKCRKGENVDDPEELP